MWIARYATSHQSIESCQSQRANDIGCGARGSNAENCVAGSGMINLQVLPSALHYVFGFLYSMAQSIVAAGNDTYDLTVGHAKRGGQLTGIEHSKTTARAGTYIKQSAAFLHAFLYCFHERFYLWYGTPYSLCHECILIVNVV
jgi:hypothetical protein